MRLTLKLRAGRHRRSLPVFQTPHHVLSEKNFFPCLCMTTLKSSSASNFAWTCFVFTKASGSWEQRRNLFRFSYENLWRLTFEVVALRIFWWKVLRLVCRNCKDSRAYGIRHLSLSSLVFRFVASDEWRQWWQGFQLSPACSWYF